MFTVCGPRWICKYISSIIISHLKGRNKGNCNFQLQLTSFNFWNRSSAEFVFTSLFSSHFAKYEFLKFYWFLYVPHSVRTGKISAFLLIYFLNAFLDTLLNTEFTKLTTTKHKFCLPAYFAQLCNVQCNAFLFFKFICLKIKTFFVFLHPEAAACRYSWNKMF